MALGVIVIVEQIILFLDRSSAYRLALVHSSLTEACLKRVWERITCLNHLMKLLPSTVVSLVEDGDDEALVRSGVHLSRVATNLHE